VTEPTTPLRRDAERNRQLLLRTAHDLMARHGLDVPYEEIARAAGTGTGTMYRRFPHRQDLVDALFSAHIDAVTDLAVEASRHPDARAGLTWFLTRQLELEAGNRGLGDLLRGPHRNAGIVRSARDRMTPLVADLIARAVQAGQLAPGITPGDLVAVHLMVGSVLDASREFAPDLWRRALAVALAGLSHADLPGDPPDDAVIESLYSAP
jgi:AcrR family transcriptional regulator